MAAFWGSDIDKNASYFNLCAASHSWIWRCCVIWECTCTCKVLLQQSYMLFEIASNVVAMIYIFPWDLVKHSTQVTSDIIINSLFPDEATWRLRCWSILAQVMACCLTAPSLCVIQDWFIISKVPWRPSEVLIIRGSWYTNQEPLFITHAQ